VSPRARGWRRLIGRHDDAASGVAAHGVPSESIVEKKEKQAEQDEQGDAIVGQKIIPLLLRSGRRHESFWPGEDDGQAFVRATWRSSFKVERTIGLLAVRECAVEECGGPVKPSRERSLAAMFCGSDRGGCVVDGEDPAVAADVPIHFLGGGEKSKLAIGEYEMT